MIIHSKYIRIDFKVNAVGKVYTNLFGLKYKSGLMSLKKLYVLILRLVVKKSHGYVQN